MILNLFDMTIKEKQEFNKVLTCAIFNKDIKEKKFEVSKGVHQ